MMMILRIQRQLTAMKKVKKDLTKRKTSMDDRREMVNDKRERE